MVHTASTTVCSPQKTVRSGNYQYYCRVLKSQTQSLHAGQPLRTAWRLAVCVQEGIPDVPGFIMLYFQACVGGCDDSYA